MSEPRGRGAGVNKPAWLAKQERDDTRLGSNGAGDESPPDADAADRRGGERSIDRDQFGRLGGNSRDYGDRRGGGGGGRRDDYDDRYNRGGRRDDYDGRSGGGRRYDDRGGGGGRRDRRGGGSAANRSGIYFHR
eukprot:scaffold1559_cov193-Alexandrium_tamarense.AAC.24